MCLVTFVTCLSVLSCLLCIVLGVCACTLRLHPIWARSYAIVFASAWWRNSVGCGCFALHCHKLGWVLSLALAEVDIVLTCKFFSVLPSTCYLSSLMQCLAYLATLIVFNSKILY